MTDGTWRGHDLQSRKQRIERAYRFESVRTANDIPVVINYPPYFVFGNESMPEDYFTDTRAMVDYQAAGYARHLARASDDFVPYFMPWFGTGVVPSAFGCAISDPEPGKDPAVAAPCLRSPADVARLKMPDPERDGQMPRVLDAIDYARDHSDLVPGLTDIQGPLDTAGLMCGQQNLLMWMFEDPSAVHDLFALVTDTLIMWIKMQKEHIGEPLDCSNGLQGVWSPKGVGVWLSEDDLVMITPELFAEFVAPCVSRVFDAFSGGSLHFCGRGVQHLGTFETVRGLRVLSNSPMGDFASWRALYDRFRGRVVLHVQDIAPEDAAAYYSGLFEGITDFRGLLVTPFVVDGLAMDASGGCVPVDREAHATIDGIVAAVRDAASRLLEGEEAV